MEIIYKSPSELKPFQKNPYNHPEKQLTMLKKSMREFGFTSPVLISQDNMVIAGHARLKAAQEIGLSEVPTIFIDLPYEKAVAYVIADNQLAKLAEEDRDLLGELLEGALSIPDFDIEAVGFSSEDIDTLLKSGEVGEVVEDEFNSDGEIETRCKEGDLWQLGRHRLLCADSTKQDNIEKLLNGAKIDLVFTDPPYGMNLDTDFSGMESKPFKGKTGGNYHEKVIGDDQPFDISQFNYLDAKEQFWWGADYYAKTLPEGGSWLVWDKRLDDSADKMWGSCFEICWSKTPHKKDIVRVKWAGIFGMEKQDTDKRVHPTQKPIELCSWFISKYSNDKSNVLDLFLGSGSTLIACEQLGRTLYGCELSPEYCDVILSRWEQFTNQTAKKLN